MEYLTWADMNIDPLRHPEITIYDSSVCFYSGALIPGFVIDLCFRSGTLMLGFGTYC